MSQIRLTKWIAQSGVSSRRGADALIQSGVVHVDGVHTTKNVLVTHNNVVTVNGKRVSLLPRRLFMYNKPLDRVVSADDEHGRESVFDDIKRRYPQIPKLIACGRLDKMSEGLLLLTTDGSLSEAITHPYTAIDRTYHVKAPGKPDLSIIKTVTSTGANINGFQYKPLMIQSLPFQIYKEPDWFSVTVSEGKNLELRNIFSHMQTPIRRLIRMSFGPYSLSPSPPSSSSSSSLSSSSDTHETGSYTDAVLKVGELGEVEVDEGVEEACDRYFQWKANRIKKEDIR